MLPGTALATGSLLSEVHRAYGIFSDLLMRNSTTGSDVITGTQIRAAGALLGWTVRALAARAVLAEHTLEWIEGEGKLTEGDHHALAALRATLEAAGIEFIGSVGVQFRRE